ncbi:MAG: insulinase family protein, partial [Myxococcota bacterium]|nr:insulinase family protein [Myxococcota bacterium]
MLALLQAAAVAAPALPALPLVVEEETLENGIRVAAVHVPDSSLVAVQVRVSGGAADEAPGESGYAHLLEHLMFGGSAHARNGSYDTWLAEVGAENNAWTEHDSTTYSVTAPAEAVELVLFLESDRLGWLAGGMDAEKLRNQIEVVAAEAAGDAAAPHGRDLAALNAAVFP